MIVVDGRLGVAVLKQGLGELELAIMNVVWKRAGPVTVPEVHRELLKSRKLAYTSTMTVMSRLHDKGVLHRREDRRPYTYWPALTREDYSADLMLGVLAEQRDRRAALARFVERIGRRDAALLAELVAKSRSRRR